MPYKSISDAKKGNFPTSLDGIKLTIDQINYLARLYDSIKIGNSTKNPMAIAWSQFRKSYKKINNKWIKKEKESVMSDTVQKQDAVNESEETLESKELQFINQLRSDKQMLEDSMLELISAFEKKYNCITSYLDAYRSEFKGYTERIRIQFDLFTPAEEEEEDE